MHTFYHTFGLGHEHQGKVQPIIARNAVDAYRAMLEKYGDKWAFQYTEEEWEANRKAGLAKEKPLKIISAPSTEQYKENVTG